MTIRDGEARTFCNILKNFKNDLFFQENYLPVFEEISDTEMYIKTTQLVHSMGKFTLSKYIIFDANKRPRLDNGAEYTMIVPDGYILKINCPYITNIDEKFSNLEDIQVVYLIKADKILITKSFDYDNEEKTYKEINTLFSETYENVLSPDFINEMTRTPKEFYKKYIQLKE